MQAACTKQQFMDRLAAVYLAIIPHDDKMTWDLIQEVTQKQGSFLGLNVVLVQLTVQSAMKPLRTDGDAGDCGDAVVTIAMAHDRRLTDRAPCLPNGRNQEETAFVGEDDVGCQPCGVFFTAGQTVRFHCSMSASFRSSARRSGF